MKRPCRDLHLMDERQGLLVYWKLRRLAETLESRLEAAEVVATCDCQSCSDCVVRQRFDLQLPFMMLEDPMMGVSLQRWIEAVYVTMMLQQHTIESTARRRYRMYCGERKKSW